MTSQSPILSTSTTTKNLRFRQVSNYLKTGLDEVPMILLELNQSAFEYIKREQFDQALTLLQKAHGVLDVVDVTKNDRDSAHSL